MAGVVALLPVSLLLSGCAAVVVGALGGAGALGYSYASANNKPKPAQTAALDPPAAAPANDPPGPSRADPPSASESLLTSSYGRSPALGPGAEAAVRPGAASQPNTAEGSLPSTIAANYPYNETLGPPNPFAANAIPRPLNGINLNSLQLATSFSTPAQPVNHATLLRPEQ